MRGKLSFRSPFTRHCRITPADAGKTHGDYRGTVCNRDHPRGCGENPAGSDTVGIAKGSPPRMRGKHVYWLNPVTRERITPADAGKT